MKRLSLHLAFLFLLLTSLASATLATDIVISASTQPNLRPTGLPAIRTGTASVSNGSASVTLSTAVPTSHVGIGGYIIELAGTNYYVANTTTTTQITLTSNFVGSSGTTTYRIFPFVLLRIYALGTFQPSGANYVVQQGAPGSGSWYKQVGVSVISDGSGSVGYIPQLTLDATTNAVNPSTQNTRYFAGFYRIEGGLIAPFLCFEQFRLPSTTTPTTWADICTFNQTTTQPNDPTTYYTARQLDDRWRACSAGQSYYFSAAGNRVSCLNYGTGLSLDTATGTLTATAASPLLGAREAVNFKRDCGGVGDGSTNNATAFENCIADMSDGDTLYLPYGNYKTNSQVLVNKRINLIGDGIGSAITCNTTISVDCVVFDRGGSTLIETARIENLAIVGGANSTRNGLVLVNFVRGDVRNVFIGTGTPSGGYGFVCEGCLINTFEQVVVSNSTPFPYTYGTPDGGMLFKGSSTYPSNANLIKNCIIEPGAGKGIFIDGATGTTGTTNNWIVGGTIEGATMTYGIHIKGANYFSVSNVHVEDLSSTFTKANIKIENSTSGFIGAGSFGNNLEFVNADDITVENLAINNLSVDSASQRNRFGNLTWNLSGTGTFADAGTESTYTGQLRNAGSANASPTGPASAAPSHNLLRNGGAEVWAGSNPTEWGVSSGTLTQTGTGLGDTRKLYGDYAVKVSDGTATTLVNLSAEELPRVLGQSITITGWVYVASGQATQPVVALQVWYNGGTSAYGIAAITATDQWVPVRLTSPVPSNATQVQAAFVNSATAAAGIYYVDGVSITLGRAGVFTEAARLPSGLNLALYNNGGYKTTLKPSNSASANLTFTLPAATAEASPTNADVMVADAGTLSFDKRAKFDSGPNLDFFPTWSNTNGTLAASSPLYKSGSHVVFNGGDAIFSKSGQTLTIGPHATTTSYTLRFPQGLTGADGCLQVNSTGQMSITGAACGSGGGGGGLTSITAPTGGAQTGPGIAFALGTSGTDASIAGSANTITFNFPTSSASNRGLLSASDFSMFNGKAAVGGSGIASTQIAVGSAASTIQGSSALTYNTATGTFAQALSTNASILHSVTNASTGNAGSVELGAYSSGGSLRMFTTSSGYSPTGLIVANQAQLNAGSGTVDMLFALTDSGASQRQRWAIGGAEQMRLTETGLGIGTTAPSTKLHVYAASANTSGIRTERMTSATTPTGGAAVVGVDGSGNFVVAAASVVTDPGANGVMVRTASNTTTARTLTGTANEITIADGTGVSANPTFSLASTFDISGKDSTKPMKVGTTAGIPGTCAVGAYYFATDAAAGSNTYACTSLNTWTVQAVAGSAGALSALTAATGSNSINNGDNAQTWNWALTTSGKTGFAFAENTAGTSAGTPHLVSISTKATSTINPLQVVINSDTTPAGIRVNTSGQVVAVGSGGVNGAAIVGANTVPNSVLDADLATFAANSTTGFWAYTGAGTGAARTITGTVNQVTVTNGNGVSGNPVLALPQDIHTTATPRFSGIGLDTSAPTAGLAVVGKTINADSTGTVAAADFQASFVKNDTNTRTFPVVQIKPTLNFGGSNNNTIVPILSVDTVNTSTTGATVYLASFAYGGASKQVFTSDGGFTLVGQTTASASVAGAYGATYTNASTNSGATAETDWLNSAGNYLRAGIRSTGASTASESFFESNGSTNGLYFNANDSGARIRFGVNNTELMRLTANSLAIGTTTAASYGSGYKVVDVRGTNGGALYLGVDSGNYGYFSVTSSDVYFYNNAAGTLQFHNNALEAARFTSANELLIGTTTSTGDKLRVGGDIGINNASSYRARNAAGSGSVNLIGLDPSNRVQISSGGNQVNVGANVVIGSTSTTPVATLHNTGSLVPGKVRAVTGTDTATSTDWTLLCDATSAGFTETLPTAASVAGRVFVIKKTDATANVVTVDPNSTETIDGSLTATLTAANETLAIVSDGTNWKILWRF